MKVKIKKEMEYEDAPCGFVTLYNYKEPFMKFEEGFGYQGVLLFDGKSDKVQCHFCGEWYHALGNHLHKEHNMRASEYKEATGLRQTTALISETMRAKLIASGLDKRLQNLRQQGKKSEEQKEKIRQTLLKKPRETQNELGTCPQQLIDRLIVLSQKLGRTPVTREIPFIDTLEKVYGNYTTACHIAGLSPRKSGQTLPRISKYTFEQLVAIVKDFYQKNNRFPKRLEMGRNIWDHYYIKQKKEVRKTVLLDLEKYQKNGDRIYLSKEELLEMIKIFREKNSRLPSVSDCKRGLLPHHARYYYHFGTFRNALSMV